MRGRKPAYSLCWYSKYYLDIEGNTCTLDAEAMLARVIQHEMDHLNGVLFIDYLSQAQQDKLMQKYISHER